MENETQETTTRISMKDNFPDAAHKLAEGNQGALKAVVDIAMVAPKVDPDAMFGAFAPLVTIDRMQVYGSRLRTFYERVCDGDTVAAIAVLRAVQLGLLPADDVIAAIDHASTQIDVADIVRQVQRRLPRFAKDYQPKEKETTAKCL